MAKMAQKFLFSMSIPENNPVICVSEKYPVKIILPLYLRSSASCLTNFLKYLLPFLWGNLL